MTLVEIIATIVILAIAGLMLFTFMNTTVHESNEIVSWVVDEAELNNELERITAEYIQGVNADDIEADFLTTFQGAINTTPTNADSVSSIATELGCLDAKSWSTSCVAYDMLKVTVTDVNNRQYVAIFSQTRATGEDPSRVH